MGYWNLTWASLLLQPSHEMDRHEITVLDSTGDSVLIHSIASYDDDDAEAAVDKAQKQPVA